MLEKKEWGSPLKYLPFLEAKKKEKTQFNHLLYENFLKTSKEVNLTTPSV